MIRPILQLGNDTLRMKALSVESSQPGALDGLTNDLSDTLHDAQRRFGYGRGIAAPQIGELKRIFLIDMPGFKSALINPTIVEASDKKYEVWDSCLSFNLAFFVLVDRHCNVRVRYFDREGKRRVVDAEYELSELLQHEIDHLNGILAIDRMKDSKIMMRSEWEKIFKKT